MSRWPIAITSYGEADPATLRANDANWRRHPERQRQAMREVLDETGFAGAVLVNTRTGSIVDGHMRVELALAEGQSVVPVLYCNLSPEQERRVLATFDPLGAMAEADAEALERLMQEQPVAAPAAVPMPEEVDEKGDDEPEVSGRREYPDERYALAIVLTQVDFRRWEEHKRAVGLATDQAAFLRMLEGAE